MSKSKYKHKYLVKYKVEGGEWDREEVDPSKGEGACDAVGIMSLIYPPDGSLSCVFYGLDGKTKGQLSDNEWFKIWFLLGSNLIKSDKLDSDRKGVVFDSLETVRKLFDTHTEITDG